MSSGGVVVVGSRSVVLMGLPGSGKTSVGQAMATLLGGAVIDVDAEVEKKASRSIADLIRVEGEQRFRDLESETLVEALGKPSSVIALGGGALLREENRTAVRSSGACVYLKVSAASGAKRTLADQMRAGTDAPIRPVLFGDLRVSGAEAADAAQIAERFEQLAAQRESQYVESSVTAIWTDTATPRAIAKVLCRELRGGSELRRTFIPTLCGVADEAASTIVIGDGLVEEVGSRLAALDPKTKAVIICDENLLEPHARAVAKSCDDAGIGHLIYSVPAGETSKSFPIFEELIGMLTENSVGKADTVVALGGGVVGDLAGFVASVYMRGIRLVQIPTTVVGQVDSAIGGKTAINTEKGKNLVGTFFPASEILIDPLVLKTLPEREYRSGLAEVVKYGVIGDQKFLTWLDQNAEKVLGRDSKTVGHMLEVCALAKARVVEQDLQDVTGIRATLNFGHTLGHALEQITEYKTYLHGEAVAWGMIQALTVSAIYHQLPDTDERKIALLLQKFGLPTEVPSELTAGARDYLWLHRVEKREELLGREAGATLVEYGESDAAKVARAQRFDTVWRAALLMDKKREHAVINFVTVNPLGCAHVTKLQLDALLRCFAWGLVTRSGEES